ncbi:MAG: hypothetical protein HY22_00275 [[Candidatus Thermochlorobacteriaceae] bacterium GBChlB]|nr:MAG: hypothetical protein HY22_00275 [[Candidatus Thermochlorobacteriaceae] bacterium GBChlB]
MLFFVFFFNQNTHSIMKKSIVFAAISLSLLAVFATSASAQLKPDVRLGIYTNGGNFSAGAGLAIPIKIPAFGTLVINPTVDYLFISSAAGSSATSIFGHADVAYQFKLSSSPITPYAGAGFLIAFSTVSVEVPTFGFGGGGSERQTSSSTSFGFNLFGGAEFPVGPLAIYAQGKLLISSGTNFQIGSGVRF